MNKFLAKLKEQATDNPALTIGAGAAAVTAVAKLVDSASAVQGRRAYAKQVKYRVKTKK